VNYAPGAPLTGSRKRFRRPGPPAGTGFREPLFIDTTANTMFCPPRGFSAWTGTTASHIHAPYVTARREMPRRANAGCRRFSSICHFGVTAGSSTNAGSYAIMPPITRRLLRRTGKTTSQPPEGDRLLLQAWRRMNYFNISHHWFFFPGGEIRGLPVAGPEPATFDGRPGLSRPWLSLLPTSFANRVKEQASLGLVPSPTSFYSARPFYNVSPLPRPVMPFSRQRGGAYPAWKPR